MSPRSALLAVLLGINLLLCASAYSAVWSEHELVGPNDTYEDWAPEIAVDPQGRPIVVWDGYGGIYWSRREMGTGWSPRQLLSPGAWPRLAMAGDGTAWAVWLRHPSGGSWMLLLSRLFANDTWAVPETVVVEPGITDSNYYGLAPIDSTACWVVFDQWTRVCARKLDGGAWGPIEIVDATLTGSRAWHVDAATCVDGEPWAAWTDEYLYASRRSPDGTWQEPVSAFGTLHDFMLLPSITVDSQDRGWVVASTSACGSQGWNDVFYSHSAAGAWQSVGVVNELNRFA